MPLDRDEVINRKVPEGYVNRLEEAKFFPRSDRGGCAWLVIPAFAPSSSAITDVFRNAY